MRILHVCPFLAPRYGGAPGAAVAITRALLQHGVDSLIAATDADGAGHLPVELGWPTTYRAVPTIFFRRQWHDAFQYSLPYARWLDRHVAEFDAVHIHLVFSFPCLAAARACRGLGVPYVVCPQGTLDPWSMRQSPVRKQLLWHVEGKRMLSGATAVQYATNQERMRTEQWLGIGHGAVIPLMLDDDVLDPQPAGDLFRQRRPALGRDPYVLVLCRLHPKKGLELFLDAFLEVTSVAEHRNWRLVLAGDGAADYRNHLSRLVAGRQGGERVLLAGWLTGDDRVAALREAALVALPSYQENFGLAIAEAMACGVSVLVTTGVDLAADIRAAGAGWIARHEYSALAATLRQALQSEDERARRGAAGKALAHTHFAPALVAAQLIDLYARVTKQGPAAVQ